MVEFLKGNALSEKIRHVVSGKDLRCAVAFWGHGAESELFDPDTLQKHDVKIICDLSMGGTNPSTLRALGAPKNKKIKYLDGLHAKVFISDNGAVIGSANASNNGIGFMGGNAQLTEAGIHVGVNSEPWQNASEWFNALFLDKRVRKIDTGALNMAQLAWDRRRKAGRQSGDQKQRGFLEYDPGIHRPIYVLWYRRDGSDAQFTNNAPAEIAEGKIENWINISQRDRDLFEAWICCFRIDDSGTMVDSPSLFYANSLFENAVMHEEGYPDLIFEDERRPRHLPPFDFEDRNLINAFREVVNDRNRSYACLRGMNVEGPWLARNYVGEMNEFWRDVQTEYRRLQVEA